MLRYKKVFQMIIKLFKLFNYLFIYLNYQIITFKLLTHRNVTEIRENMLVILA